MGLLSNIMNKIFRVSAKAERPFDAAPPTPAAPGIPSASATATMTEVDVEAILDKMAAEHGEKLNWKTSIVDLMKLLGMDSSITNRKELAAELKYTGDTNDSATMNIWLHKAVMKKVAENGGKVPADLLD
jgi:hypothetical protein